MTWVESLQKAIDYMEEHLTENISMADIAKQANISLYHFQRAFALLTDISVGEYLRRRRLTLAAHDLSKNNTKVIDIAFKYGYETPEAFSKAFRRQHGISPKEARTYDGKLKSYNRLVIQINLKGAEPMQYQIVDKEEFQVTGVKESFSMMNEENLEGIPKMWRKVNTDGTSDKLFDLNNGPVKGLLGVIVTERGKEAKNMDYWIAAAHKGESEGELKTLTIPASTWAIFEVHGAMPDAMPLVWKKIYGEWFPSSSYENASSPSMEVYPEGDAYQSDYYSEIWIPIK
ncbi:AraC family transcriptional regulator [Halobacillus sp. A1]|uniref:AraC family transcriptional regulator n=1 Tax=Halobacillus sp. A1 TaxID=2880262 RepID=UPI0020A6B9CC|nr:AraC family transcriptional regulator [Halobacillus sp. A1]MCP3032026.1 AraC family transcriptional regulator [Halobacillus sp. A1]